MNVQEEALTLEKRSIFIFWEHPCLAIVQISSEEIVIPCEDLINRELENTDIRNAKHEVKKTSTQRIYIHQITNVSRIITIFAPK